MLLNNLSVTCDMRGRPNRLATSLHSTQVRLYEILNRSILFSYVTSVYNKDHVLFITEIYHDLRYEIASIAASETKIESNFVYDLPNYVVDFTNDRMNILALCSYFIGDRELPPANAAALVSAQSPKFNIELCAFYEAWARFCFAESERRLGETPASFIVSNVRVPILFRRGFSIEIAFNDRFVAEYEYDSANQIQLPLMNIMRFQSGLLIPEADIDVYMHLLAHSCIEPNPKMFRIPQGYNSPPHLMPPMYQTMIFLRKVYNCGGIQEVVRDLSHGRNLIRDYASTCCIDYIVQYVSYLHGRFRVPAGRATSTVIAMLLETDNAPESTKKLYNYIRGVITNPQYVATAEESLAFKQSITMYTPFLDISSKHYVGAFMAKDDDLEEEEDGADDLDDPPADDDKSGKDADDDLEDDDSDGDEEDPGEDPTDDDSDKDDLGDDDSDTPVEDPEPPAEPPPSSNDKAGLTINTDKVHTLDSYLFRREVGFRIDEYLKNPPANATTEKLAVLKRIKTQWLYLLSISSIHEILTKVVNILPVKLSK